MTVATGRVRPCRHGRGTNAMRTMALGTALAGVLAAEPASAAGTLEHMTYGKTQAGQAVDIFTMTNGRLLYADRPRPARSRRWPAPPSIFGR
jgi:hypothetical protein